MSDQNQTSAMRLQSSAIVVAAMITTSGAVIAACIQTGLIGRLSESRMTVSTSGIIPRIIDFGGEPVRPKLAISLNASNDEVRSRIMPLNRKWNLEMLLQAVREFPLRNRERITFEYVLLDGVNDSATNARELTELVRGIRCKVNLIALNPGPGIAFRTPAEQRVQAFKDLLNKAGVPVFVRRPRGRDIYAACGQLKRTVA